LAFWIGVGLLLPRGSAVVLRELFLRASTLRVSSPRRPEPGKRSRGSCYRNVWLHLVCRKDRCASAFLLMRPVVISQICIQPVRIDGGSNFCPRLATIIFFKLAAEKTQ
jgi:hypothetical protein